MVSNSFLVKYPVSLLLRHILFTYNIINYQLFRLTMFYITDKIKPEHLTLQHNIIIIQNDRKPFQTGNMILLYPPWKETIIYIHGQIQSCQNGKELCAYEPFDMKWYTTLFFADSVCGH